ncbi:hypothetical protein FXN61_24045 [Lentzea sp. PSKA42]|uniref:Uncharacterized protein n=1 Tax=Lentzea indica TaxID=2604800 RepID=A0ABX1FLB1_9PSEU|nr:hypothetical protein [Lentzea indica]NKE59715.1 hypothetical protein [Lentzea indica]
MTPRRRTVNLVLIAVLAAATGLVTNYASADMPEWFKDDPVRVWLVFGLVVMAGVLVQVLVSRESHSPPRYHWSDRSFP